MAPRKRKQPACSSPAEQEVRPDKRSSKRARAQTSEMHEESLVTDQTQQVRFMCKVLRAQASLQFPWHPTGTHETGANQDLKNIILELLRKRKSGSTC